MELHMGGDEKELDCQPGYVWDFGNYESQSEICQYKDERTFDAGVYI